MPFRISFIILFAFILGGCHNVQKLLPPNLRPPSAETTDSLALARQQLQQATPCCSSFADFSYRSPLPWRPQKFTLGPGSTAANLNGTHSYFLAFSLPAQVKLPYRIAVKSELNGRWLHASYLFAPSVVVLDEAFQPLLSKDINLCEHVGWGADTTGAFGSIKVTSKQARYLLVYSSQAQQTGDTYWEQSPASFSNAKAATLNMGSRGSFSIPHGPDGTLWIGMIDAPYAKAIDSAICDKPTPGQGILSILGKVVPRTRPENAQTS